MPDPVFYIRGIPPQLADAYATSPDMLEDLEAVASLTDEQIGSLCKKLSEAKGFLDPKTLRTTISSVIVDDNTAGSALRVLRNLGPKDVTRLLKVLSERVKEEEIPLSQDVLNQLNRVLPALIQVYPALARYEKANRLATLTGQQLESIDLICDIRPIFDEDRKRLEGMMPYTRLRVVATGADGLPKLLEAELTQQQVSDLAQKAEKAKAKLNVLRESVQSWVPGGLPDLPLTRIPRKDSSDD